MKFTVFGSSGYIGTSLVNKLESENIEYSTPDLRKWKITDENLGHVVYAIGGAGTNFKENPLETLQCRISGM